jgi:hypothetical protein
MSQTRRGSHGIPRHRRYRQPQHHGTQRRVDIPQSAVLGDGAGETRRAEFVEAGVIPQCATCINQPVVMTTLWRMTTDMHEFNERFALVQGAARTHKCPDYWPDREYGR